MTDQINTRAGTYRTTRRAMMSAFDELPLAARRALADAVENWAPQPLLDRYGRGARAVSLRSLVRAWDQREVSKRADQRARSIGPYKGNARM